MKDLDDLLGLSDSEWKEVCQTQQAQVAIGFFINKMKESCFTRLLNANTIEEFLTIKGLAIVVNEADKKIRKTRKDKGAKAEVKTYLPFRNS